MISKLKDVAWDATEQLSFDEVERSDAPFKLVFRLLDDLYQYEDLIEVPSRCDEFFSDFQRNKGEELQAYLIRHKTLLKRMKEVNVEVPPLLSGWHLLTRAGVPRWTHVQLKAMCGGDLDYDKVSKALVRMFGGDHRPNARDLGRANPSSVKEENYYEDEEEIWYEEDDWDEWYEDEVFEAEEDEDDVPEELEDAMDQADEAYVSYIESRKRMKELALSRGFYPIVALGPEAEKGAFRNSKGEGKSKGKGKSSPYNKGKGKGKSKGGGFMRRTPFNRRPMSGLRKGPVSSASTTASSEKSTFSGSTAQHGPRFKRYRSQNQGVKEVPEEVTMVEECDTMAEVIGSEVMDQEMEQCFFTVTEVGKAIVDSGATRTIVGENNWHQWLEKYGTKGTKPIVSRQIQRQFKFGGGETLTSNYEVDFTAVVHGQMLDITASVVPGATPFLLARPTLEEWGVIHDYKNGLMKIGSSDWFQPERNGRGHFLLDLMMYRSNNAKEETYYQFEEVLDLDECVQMDEVALIDEGPLGIWDIEPTMEENGATEEFCQEVFEAESIAAETVRRLKEKRILKFFEVYVDQGNLSVHLARRYEDVEVSGFSLPEWNFLDKGVRAEFADLLREVSPDFVWIAPPCRKWSSIQRLNLRTEAQRKKLMKERRSEEESHLSLVSEVAKITKEDENNYACEHPHGADSWKTKTMESMKGYFEAVCNRCRTGLWFDDGHCCGPVRKQTRIRTSSRKVAEALNLACQCEGRHVPMDGKSKELREMQNYEHGFVERAAEAIYATMEESWRKKEIAKIMAMDVMVAEETDKKMEDEDIGPDDEMVKTHNKKAMMVIDKLHRQLGHPGRDRLVAAVREAGLDEALVRCAKVYKCDTCQNFRDKKMPKPASLPQTSFFNEMLEMDIFHIKWNEEKKRILAVIDLFSRYEMNVVVQSETEKEELAVLDQWINAFGCPKQIRTDASGAHMSEQFLQYMDDRGIKLVLVPKEAHHRMGTVERLHAVRRLQLLKMKQENEKLQLEVAVPVACNARNHLRSVHGSSPAQIVYGKTSSQKGLMDEPLAQQAEPTAEYQKLASLRLDAAKAFYSANHSQTLRKALLSKSRSENQVF